MNILIACHCKEKHRPVYLHTKTTSKSLYDDKLIDDIKKEYHIKHIDYIDIRCKTNKTNNQYSNWDELSRKYDIIFFIHCPIYGIFHKTYKKEEYQYMTSYQKMYMNCKKHLKKKGFIHIPVPVRPFEKIKKLNTKKYITVYDDIFKDISDYKLEFVKKYEFTPFDISLDFEKEYYDNVMILSF